MKESSIESRTRDENQTGKEAARGNTAAASFFCGAATAEQLVAVMERADNSIRCDQNPVDDVL
jgi:hypothetical protein